MASVQLAIDYVLRWEDSRLSGVITTTPDGKRTRFGIDEHWHPELSASLFYTSMGRDAALAIAEGIYVESYCAPLSIEEIANQDIANKVLSIGVNIGVKQACKMLQSAVGVSMDGSIGAYTLLALSKCEPNDVLASLRAQSERYYVNVVADHPEDERYLPGWLARARA